MLLPLLRMQIPVVNDDTLLQLLQELYTNGSPAALFVEDGGMGSENGHIRSIDPEAGSYRIVLENGTGFLLGQVMAVNGVFRTGFSTC